MSDAPDWLDESVPLWLADYAAALDVPAPSAADIEELLKVAGVAAHASRRQAAPVATWLAAQAGLSPTEALARAKEIPERD